MLSPSPARSRVKVSTKPHCLPLPDGETWAQASWRDAAPSPHPERAGAVCRAPDQQWLPLSSLTFLSHYCKEPGLAQPGQGESLLVVTHRAQPRPPRPTRGLQVYPKCWFPEHTPRGQMSRSPLYSKRPSPAPAGPEFTVQEKPAQLPAIS